MYRTTIKMTNGFPTLKLSSRPLHSLPLTPSYLSPQGFSGDATGKEHACQCRRRKRHRFHPWVGKIPWRRARQPTPVFLPEESYRTEDPRGLHTVHWVTKSRTCLKWLSMHAYPPLPRQPLIWFLPLYISLHFLDFDINGIIPSAFFFIWLLSHSIMILRHFHVVAHMNSWLLLILSCISWPGWTPICYPSPVERLSVFKASINIYIQFIMTYTFILLG